MAAADARVVGQIAESVASTSACRIPKLPTQSRFGRSGGKTSTAQLGSLIRGDRNVAICCAQHMATYVARRTMLRTALSAKAHLAACVLTAACGEGGVSDR